jgi:Methylamine utilization protein MauJ
LSLDIRIEPDIKPIRQGFDQTGTIFITLPISYNDSKPFAYDLAHRIANRISFSQQGQFNLHLGLVFCKSIPETEEEKKEIGDKPYSGVMHLEEVIKPFTLDSADFVKKLNTTLDNDLILMHNMAKNSSNLIDKFMGFFKIIENYCVLKDNKESLKDCLDKDERLFNIFHTTFNFSSLEHAQESFIKFIESIVHARHRCAHLKKNKKFGYLPDDPRIQEQVDPLIQPMEILTYQIIINSMTNQR